MRNHSPHQHPFTLNASFLRIRHLSFLVFHFSLLTIHFSFGQRLIDHVNPFIGTMNAGHTYPGASMPFGAVQLSPDTDTIPFSVNGKYTGDVYKYCAGYQYEDPTIVGFSHTHFSGTGHSDLGDILLMPGTGEVQLNPFTHKYLAIQTDGSSPYGVPLVLSSLEALERKGKLLDAQNRVIEAMCATLM
jgi:putative alpha-1,2-mannosidase